MATAGTIGVNLWCNVTGFTRGLQTAASSLTTFQGSIGGGVGGLAKFGLGLAGIAAPAVMAYAAINNVRSALDDIDSKRDLGARLGATVQELRQLEFAAGQSGASMEGLTTGLSKMLKTLGEARGGNDTAAESFKALGLSADELASMSAAESFSEIAERIKQIPNPADRAALAMKIFGKGAGELIPLMLEGKDGIAGLAKEFDNIGGVVTALDADKVDDFNDSIGRLSASWKGLWTTISQSAIVKAPGNFLAESLQGWRLLLSGEFANSIRNGWQPQTSLPIPRQGSENPLAKMAREAEEAKKLAKEHERLAKLREQQQQRGNALAGNNLLPIEMMAKKMAELNELLGVGAINWHTYERATAAAKNELRDTISEQYKLKDPGKQSAGAVLKGSAAAFTAISSARSEAAKQSEIAKQQLAIEKQMAETLRSIDENAKSKIIVREVGL